MKLEVVPASRRPHCPWWAVVCVLVWAVSAAGAVSLAAHTRRKIELCAFKHLTGLACPTCGSTRGLRCLIEGRVAQSWRKNPLVFTALGVAVSALLFRAVCGRRVRLCLTRRQRKLAWAVGAAALLGNWAYVISCVG